MEEPEALLSCQCIHHSNTTCLMCSDNVFNIYIIGPSPHTKHLVEYPLLATEQLAVKGPRHIIPDVESGPSRALLFSLGSVDTFLECSPLSHSSQADHQSSGDQT